jgi:hypothetical protein
MAAAIEGDNNRKEEEEKYSVATSFTRNSMEIREHKIISLSQLPRHLASKRFCLCYRSKIMATLV